MSLEEISSLRREMKAGLEAGRQRRSVSDLYSKVSALYSDKALDHSLYPDFGWLIYYKMRSIPINSVLARKRMLVQYFNLELERPSLLHSLILSQALKLKEKYPSQFRIREFVKLWGIEFLREKDWERLKPENGHAQNSLVEKLIGTYAREIKKLKVEASEDFSRLVDRAIQVYNTNPHLPIYKGVVLVSQGKIDMALEHYKTLLRRWPGKFFLWSSLEELVPSAYLDIKTALLCKAVTLVRDQGYIGDIRLRLANLLYKKGLYAYARYELAQYEQCYTMRRWHIKDWCDTISNRVGAKAPGIPPSPTPYTRYLPLAENYIKA